MAIGCKNCGSYFTLDEVMRRKPPVHPWPLTTVGQRTQDANLAGGGNTKPCPNCGRSSLNG